MNPIPSRIELFKAAEPGTSGRSFLSTTVVRSVRPSKKSKRRRP